MNTLIDEIIQIHNYRVHPSYICRKNTVPEYMNIEKWKRYLRIVCDNCINCQMEKVTNEKIGAIKIQGDTPELYGEISVDLKGPIKTSYFQTGIKNKSFYILAICKTASRYSKIEIFWNIGAETCVRQWKKYI